MGDKIFKIKFEDFEELKNEDASLSFGYFEFNTVDFKVSFFEERHCMVFITLSSLLDFLNRELKKGMQYKWIGDGNGTAIMVKVINKGRLEFTLDRISFCVDIKDFTKAVYIELNSFLSKCIGLNPEVQTESGYVTLKNSFNVMKIKEKS